MRPTQVTLILSQARERYGENFLVRVVAITDDGYFTFEGELRDYQEGMFIMELDEALIFIEADKVSAVEVSAIEEEEKKSESSTTH